MLQRKGVLCVCHLYNLRNCPNEAVCCDHFDLKSYFLVLKSEIKRKKETYSIFRYKKPKPFVVKQSRLLESLVKCFSSSKCLPSKDKKEAESRGWAERKLSCLPGYFKKRK